MAKLEDIPDAEFVKALGELVNDPKVNADQRTLVSVGFLRRLYAIVVNAAPHLAPHEHRYPTPNGQGFPVTQCLDCGEWAP